MRTRKVAQHTAPSQPLARDVPAASDRLASLCAPLCAPTMDSLTLSTFQIGPSTHRSPSGVDSDSDSEDHSHCHRRHHHQQYTPSRRDARKPPKRDEQINGEDADVDVDVDIDADADADDDDVAIVPPPFAPPPCLFIQPSAAVLSPPVTSFSLAQPALAPPKMPLFPFMPLLPTPRERSSPPPPE